MTNSPERAPRKVAQVGIVAALVGVLGVGVGFSFFSLGGARGGLDDVGELERLGGVQAQLALLDACRIEYNMHIRQRDGKIRVLPCASLPYVLFPVPANWPYRDISFLAERSARHKRWAIRVERSRVSFPDLVGALESMTPMIVAQYPAALAATEARERAGLAAVKAQEEERRRASERAKESYPSK